MFLLIIYIIHRQKSNEKAHFKQKGTKMNSVDPSFQQEKACFLPKRETKML